MRESDTNRAAWWLRAAFAWGLLAWGFVPASAAFVGAAASGLGNYQLGDWLINYAGGPVRRGLFGTLALAAVPPGVDGLVALAWVVVALGAVPLALALAHLHRRGYAWSDQALLLGPAALLFSAWDAGAFGRKEVLAYVTLTLLVGAARATSTGRAWAFVGAATATWLLALGSWEGCLFVLPAVLYVAGRGRLARLAPAVLAGASLLGAGFVTWARGTVGQRGPSCDALRDHGFDTRILCEGAVQYLGQSPQEVADYVALHARINLGFVPWALLALLPILATRWWRCHPVLVVASLVAIAPAFLVGIDVGRWISLFAVGLVFCWVVDDADGPAWSGLSVVAYCTAWGLPHADNFTAWPGLGALHQLSQLLSGW